MNKRVRLMPEFNTGSRLWCWTLRYAYANEWRIIPVYDALDVVQEGYLIFYKCKNNPDITTPLHFDFFYKKSVRNFVTDLARRRMDNPVTANLDMLVDCGKEYHGFLEVDGREVIDNAPFLVKKLVNNVDVLNFIGRPPRLCGPRSRKSRAAWNKRLCEIAGIRPCSCDLIRILERWSGVVIPVPVNGIGANRRDQ